MTSLSATIGTGNIVGEVKHFNMSDASDDGDGVENDENYDDDSVVQELDYETMKAAMEYEKNHTLNAARIKEGYSELKNNISAEIGNTTDVFKEMFTPDFLKRLQFKKKFPAKVSASER